MKSSDTPSLASFLLLTFAISWLCWVPLAVLRIHAMSFPAILPYLLGGFGPSLAAAWLVRRTLSPAARRDFWRRVIDLQRISALSWLIIVAGVPLFLMSGVLISFLRGEQGAGFTGLRQVMAEPVSLLPTVIIGLVAGPLSEELGWRGFALDHLRARFGSLVGTLVLGVIWALWHLPLFFQPGTSQFQIGFGTFGFWSFLLTTIPLAFLLTLVYDHSRRSIAAAVLLHFTFNFVFSLLFPLNNVAELWKTVFFLAAGAAAAVFLQSTPDEPAPAPSV